MACGTGKTLTSLWIKEELKETNFSLTSLFKSPESNLSSWKNNAKFISIGCVFALIIQFIRK